MRFKKMHIVLMVIALCLVLGSVQMAPKEAKATAGVQYYYSFESSAGHHYGGELYAPSSFVTYEEKKFTWNGQHPVNYVEYRQWDLEDSGNFINMIGLQGTAKKPQRIQGSARNGTYSFRLWDNVGSPYSDPDINVVHANDTADRSQVSLIPSGQDGFKQGSEYYIGFSMKIPVPTDSYPLPDHFASSEGQWVSLFHLHADPWGGKAPFAIYVATGANDVTSTEVRLKGSSEKLTCTSSGSCPVTLDDTKFSRTMERGVWYDFIVQVRMGQYVYVQMKKHDESWSNNGLTYGRQVYQYVGPLGYSSSLDTSSVRYFPMLDIYRGQYPVPQNDSQHNRDRKHVIYIDEVRVGTENGWPSAILPGQ